MLIPPMTRKQRATVLSGVSWIVVLLVILQLWLLTATMNAMMGGDRSIAWPALLASAACYAVNVWVVRRVFELQRSKD